MPNFMLVSPNARFFTYLPSYEVIAINYFIFLFFLFIQCFKRVTRLASSAILPCGPLYNNYVHIYKQSNEHKQYIFS